MVKDSLLYQYNRDASGHLTDNKLNWLNGVGNATHFGTPQYVNNYGYDPIGNMIYNRQDSITNINWSVYGKIQTITDTGKTISYVYNTTQERVAKTANGLTTWYVKDAQGNPIAIYDNKLSQLNWREQHIYGSDRVGIWQPNMNIALNNAPVIADTLGHMQYEGKNHLGNVLTTISDARTSISSYYKPIIETAQDYYAFGALMPGRSVNTANTRYGFNGKENDNEVKGVGNQQSYGKRIYDPRVGKFLSVDPIANEYPELSSYQFGSNSPLKFIDLDGKEASTFGIDVFAEAYSSSNGHPDFVDFTKAILTVIGENINGTGDAIAGGLKGVVMFVPNLLKSTTNNIQSYQQEQASYIMHRGQEYDQIKQNGGDYNHVVEEHEIRQASNGLKIAKNYEDWFALSLSGLEINAHGIISTTFARRTAIDKLAGRFSEFEARTWYKAQEARIPSLLTRDASLEIQAKEAFALRNQFRTEARRLMSNREAAKYFSTEEPNLTWDEIVEKYTQQGYKGENLWNKIIETSQKSRASADKAAGIK